MEQGLRALNHQEKQALWCERVSACRRSGLSVRQWCQENGVSPKTYYHWQHKLFDLASERAGAEFVQVPLNQKPQTNQPVATLHIGNLSADIYSSADAEVLEALCRAMKSC